MVEGAPGVDVLPDGLAEIPGEGPTKGPGIESHLIESHRNDPKLDEGFVAKDLAEPVPAVQTGEAVLSERHHTHD